MKTKTDCWDTHEAEPGITIKRGSPVGHEKTLWLNVLNIAVSDLFLSRPQVGARKKQIQKIQKEAFEWFLSNDVKTGSFLWICKYCGVDSEFFLSAVMEKFEREGTFRGSRRGFARRFYLESGNGKA